MTRFYLEKNGFNVYMEKEVPNFDRCDGLYATVEETSGFLGTKLQVVFRDCQNNEIFRTTEGRSKFKDKQKAYQDALRNSMSGLSSLGVRQRKPELRQNNVNMQVSAKMTQTNNGAIPTEKYSSYNTGGKNYLLQKTDKGFSLYEETPSQNEKLQLVGTLSVGNDETMVFSAVSGEKRPVSFTATGDLIIGSEEDQTTYLKADQ